MATRAEIRQLEQELEDAKKTLRPGQQNNSATKAAQARLDAARGGSSGSVEGAGNSQYGQHIVGQDLDDPHAQHYVTSSGGRRRGVTRQSDPVGYSYIVVYGRMPTPEERATHSDYEGGDPNDPYSYDQSHVRHDPLIMSLAEESGNDAVLADMQAAGTYDPNIDPATLKDWEKPFYDEWKKRNPDEPFTSNDRWSIRFYNDAGNLNAYIATLDGDIVTRTEKNEETGAYTQVTYVLPSAADKYDESNPIWLAGNKPGGALVVYDNSMIDDRSLLVSNARQQDQEGLPDGMSVYSITGNLRRGLIRGEVGNFFTDTLSPQVQALLTAFTPLRFTGSIFFGHEFTEGAITGISRLTSSSEDTARSVYHGMQQAAVVAMYFVPGVGPVMATTMAAAMQTMNNINNAYTYNTSLSDAFAKSVKQAGVSFAMLGVSELMGLGGFAPSAKGGINLTNITQATIYHGIRGGLNELIVEDGSFAQGFLSGAAGGVVSGVIGGAVATSFSKLGWTNAYADFTADVVTGAAGGYAGGYLNAVLKYKYDDEFRTRIDEMKGAGVISGRSEYFREMATEQMISGAVSTVISAGVTGFKNYRGELGKAGSVRENMNYSDMFKLSTENSLFPGSSPEYSLGKDLRRDPSGVGGFQRFDPMTGEWAPAGKVATSETVPPPEKSWGNFFKYYTQQTLGAYLGAVIEGMREGDTFLDGDAPMAYSPQLSGGPSVGAPLGAPPKSSRGTPSGSIVSRPEFAI